MAGPTEEERVRSAVARSFLGALPDETQRQLAVGAIRLDLPPGATFYRDEEAPRVAIVVAGLVRVFLTSPEGRQLTVRYARPGEVLGAPTAIAGPVDVSAQALTETELVMLDLERIRTAGRTNPAVGWLLAEEVTRRLYDVLAAFAGDVFGSVRQRVARHVLNLAADHQHGAMLVAPVTQQELADAVGTAREVVARTLHDLRGAGLIERSRAGLVVLDPDALGRVASSGDL